MIPDSVTVVLFIVVIYALMFEVKDRIDARKALTHPTAEEATDHDHAEHQ